MSKRKPDYTQYYERLQSYNDPHQWAGESNVYIKDLVEAGFVYTGDKDLVFCFKCGLLIGGWREDHNAVVRHQEQNKNCPFLLERLRKLTAATSPGTSTGITTGYKSLTDFERESLIYDWVPGRGVVPRDNEDNTYEEHSNVSNLNTTVGNYWQAQSSSSTVTSLANAGMRLEKKRYESFALCPVNKHWPTPETLSSAGFYYTGDREEMRCFCCGVYVDGWESSDQDVMRKHRSLSPSCAFVLGQLESEVELERRIFEQLSITSTREIAHINHSNRSSVPPTTPTQDASVPINPVFARHRGTIPNTQANYVASPTRLPSYPKDSSLQNNVNPIFPSHYSSRDLNSSRGEHHMIPNIEQTAILPPNNHTPYHVYASTSPPSNFSTSVHNSRPPINSSTYTPGFDRYNFNSGTSSINPGVSYGVSSAGVSQSISSSSSSMFPSLSTTTNKSIDLSDKKKRLETFFTWPRNSFLQPNDLAEAGFVYTGKGDGVSCYKCKILLKQWQPGDTAWSEHWRWSPACPLVIEYIHRQSSGAYMNGDAIDRSGHGGRTVQRGHVPRETCSSLNENSLRQEYLQKQYTNIDGYGSSRSLPLPSNVETSTTHPMMKHSFDDLPGKAKYNTSYYTDDYRSSGTEYPPVPDGVANGHPVFRVPGHTDGYYEPVGEERTTFPPQPLSYATSAINGFTKTEQSRNYSGYYPQVNKTASTPPTPLSPVKKEKRFTARDIRQLVEMGFSEDVIYSTINCYNEYAPMSFNNLNDLAQAVLYYQQYGHLEGSPFGKNLNVEPSSDGKNMIFDRADNHLPINVGNADKSDGDKQCCKICMDNDVEVTFVPCGHLIVCESCAFGLKECPLCRSEIKETVRTYYFGN